jgi:hypothetical protein
MYTITNREWIKLTRKLLVSFSLLVIVFFASASKGGGGDKKTNSFRTDFEPLRSLNTFTLRSTPIYSGNYSITHENNRINVNTSFSYQRGNTIFIMPYKYKVNVNSNFSNAPKTNLQFLGVKIKLNK